MKLRSRRVAALVALGLVAAAWLTWVTRLRPVDPRTGPRPVALSDGWTLSTPRAEGFDEQALVTAAERLMDRPLNVHAILVERHGRLVLEMYQGGPDRSVYSLLSTRQSFGPGTLHDVRSVGKTVTSLLYGVAFEQRKVPAPDAALDGSFPHLDGVAADNARRIRVRDLLDMSSGLEWTEGRPGLNDELKLFWKTDVPTYVLDRPIKPAPGTRFNYNGGGTALLAQLIADGTGKPLDEFANERLFAPMGITRWAWLRDTPGRPMAFNGLRLRPRDLLKFGRLALEEGRWNGRQLVPADWIRDAWAPGLRTDVADFRYRAQWWSGTVSWRGRPIRWHAAFGNGGQRLFVVPQLDLAVATTAGAYDELPTAIAVNEFIGDVVRSVAN
ncbi:class C beta-lactamase-related serine hydrolase [Lysobacter sp. TY2-98]|uniref:serine hydrolase domain-containing protein n=1 Tax=Lysobacter sp. TY2-98 TaxID=2290922 RepID=UPI000E20234D|nr:serine hydrolase [Lysobacter sp. TY2-98]AXK71173.1 class C beta-lactamase-related serine hydrolase [Lysobacter sp. TY2-98]